MADMILLPFTNFYFFGNLLAYTSLLSLSGLGIFIAYRAGVFNLGGEGQIYLGGFLGTIAGLYLFSHTPIFISKIGLFFISFLAGGILAVISGYLKYFFKVSEFISTFLISEIVIIFVNVVLRSHFQDPEYGITSTLPLPKTLLFKKILSPSILSLGIFISIILVIFMAYLLKNTIFGYEIRIFGFSPLFAFYGGIDIKRQIFIPLFISGGILGFTGMMSILARDGRFIQGFSYGLGWDGIVISLICRGNPFWIIPGALFLSYLKVIFQIGGIYALFPIEIGHLVRALIFLLLTIGAFSYLGEKDV